MTPTNFNTENLIQQLPVICIIKDKKSKYMHINQYGLNVFKYDGVEEVLGKTDFELPCSEYADVFLYQDKAAIKGESKYYIDKTIRKDGKRMIVLHKKTPYLDGGLIEGIICSGFELTRENYQNIIFSLAAANINFVDFVRAEENVNRNFEYNDIEFTKRQAQIIGHLLRGNTAESTAKHLSRSKRTIEKHIEQIRNKLECDTKTELVDKAFEIGFIDLMFMKVV